ncbi:MAG: hypothetical protein FJZ88_03055, partial [Chloroflexi bacterium]|nr:hypothetical protein [Chloroflexota bacterium]
MLCPTCKNLMIVVEYHNIELDHCINCKGVWFDSGELELLLKSVGAETTSPLLVELATHPEAATLEKKRKCPICGHKMRKTRPHEEPELVIDVCQSGDGLWFDGGEVAQLISKQPEKLLGKQDSE